VATKLNSTRSICCRNRQQIGNSCRYVPLCCQYVQLCCRFWQQIGNKVDCCHSTLLPIRSTLLPVLATNRQQSRLLPFHFVANTFNFVAGFGNISATKSTVAIPLCCQYVQLCCRFWQQIGNNMNSTVCSSRFVASVYEAKATVDFQQS